MPIGWRTDTLETVDISLKPELAEGILAYTPPSRWIFNNQSNCHSTIFGGILVNLSSWELEPIMIF
jgi:hypothetical protein